MLDQRENGSDCCYCRTDEHLYYHGVDHCVLAPSNGHCDHDWQSAGTKRSGGKGRTENDRSTATMRRIEMEVAEAVIGTENEPGPSS